MKIDTTYHWHVFVEKFDGAKNYHELLIVESDKGYFIEDEPHRDMREYDSIPIEYIGSTKYVAKSSDFFKTLKDCVKYINETSVANGYRAYTDGVVNHED